METKIQYKIFINNFLYIIIVWGNRNLLWDFTIINKKTLSYYYNIFFTTRNFLFFGLFYVVLGYYVGTKEKAYSKYCFLKLIVSFSY